MGRMDLTEYDLRRWGVEAEHGFERARRHAFLESITALLRGRPDDLLSFDEVQRKLRLRATRDRGVFVVPLDHIVGSVGKYREFTRSFWPRDESLKERWKRVYTLSVGFTGLPPVELLQVGDVYFVADGNHRVSVGRLLGNKTIEAHVVEYLSPISLQPDITSAGLDALALDLERQHFLQCTRLLELRPLAEVELSQLGGYEILEQHMGMTGYVMGMEHGQTVSWEQAVTTWYDQVYLPLVQSLREQGLAEHQGDGSPGDLYLWLMENRQALADLGGPQAAVLEVASHFVESHGSQLKWILESRPSPGRWRRERVIPRQDGRLFVDILVPLSTAEGTWQVLEQAKTIAGREQAVLHGAYLGRTVEDHQQGASLLARFAKRCAAGHIAWAFREEIAASAGSIYEHSRGFDLVILPRQDEAAPWPGPLMGSQAQGIIHRIACPVLFLTPEPTPMDRALLAYDGSPNAEEALFVAAALAARWACRLRVITVEESPRTSSGTLKRALDYLEQRGVEAAGLFRSGPIGDEILRSASDEGANLLILGDTGYSPFVELFARSTLDQVLREATCPVLVAG